ncbi:MAG: hypothetical protein IH977_09520 [Nitrospinae bacterium]|nr:hypothetical protein [Nitrospinota bacterium]
MSVEEDTRGSLSVCRVYCAVDRERREKKNGRIPTQPGKGCPFSSVVGQERLHHENGDRHRWGLS